MSVIYEVRAEYTDGRAHSFGARRTRDDAEALLRESAERVERLGSRNDRYWIEEIDTTGMFEIPSRPTPREQYTTRVTPSSVTSSSGEGTWTTVRVEVLDRGRVVASYDRNYSMLDTFEPFRQHGRPYALVSPDYTATSVMDLTTGEIIAGEKPHAGGFCPVGFYVPDWWDVHDGSVLPGSMYWDADKEWPDGKVGFVWGCIWGDDSSWKAECLDLSEVRAGRLRRDDRFGYVELATHPRLTARDFIRCSSFEGKVRVELSVLQAYDLDTGRPIPS